MDSGDYKEGYYIGVEVPEDDSDAENPFYGPNVWPSIGNLDFALLSNHINFSHLSIYAFSEVAKAIARLIALALDLGATFFDQQEMLGKPIAMFRLLHCEGLISDPTKGLYGAVAHSNFGLVTLLATDDVAGLQICKHKDVKPQIWEHVAPLKGEFIVNLGDMLERWSNSVFRSTLHRVLGNGQERYSVRPFESF
ncbi:unnamed protein product [Ilex paraguariensis]|uniref:Fe2OG dioxygenase domain-containing protein n=1 Tax=Ilex paraguariensis TaxID=185542 RepID=A0ABC8U0S3_9AQUA